MKIEVDVNSKKNLLVISEVRETGTEAVAVYSFRDLYDAWMAANQINTHTADELVELSLHKRKLGKARGSDEQQLRTNAMLK